MLLMKASAAWCSYAGSEVYGIVFSTIFAYLMKADATSCSYAGYEVYGIVFSTIFKYIYETLCSIHMNASC